MGEALADYAAWAALSTHVPSLVLAPLTTPGEAPFDETTVRLASKTGAPPERLWNLVKEEPNGFDTYQALQQTRLGDRC
ncbi:hypothetical protein WJX77_010752 [Trebouxia sp. C0004]